MEFSGKDFGGQGQPRRGWLPCALSAAGLAVLLDDDAVEELADGEVDDLVGSGLTE